MRMCTRSPKSARHLIVNAQPVSAGSVHDFVEKASSVGTGGAPKLTPTFAKDRLHKVLEAWGHRLLQLPYTDAHFLHPRVLEVPGYGSGIMDMLESGFDCAQQLDDGLTYAGFVKSVVAQASALSTAAPGVHEECKRALTQVLLAMASL